MVNETYTKVTEWGHIDSHWFEQYKEVQEYEPRCVKVSSIDESANTIEMEDLSDYQYSLHSGAARSDCEDEYHSDVNHEMVARNFFELMANLHAYGTKTFFYHLDLHAGNILIREDGDIKLIDPDAFQKYSEKKKHKHTLKYKTSKLFTEFTDLYYRNIGKLNDT